MIGAASTRNDSAYDGTGRADKTSKLDWTGKAGKANMIDTPESTLPQPRLAPVFGIGDCVACPGEGKKRACVISG